MRILSKDSITKKLLACIAAAAMVVLMCGCKGDGNSEAPDIDKNSPLYKCTDAFTDSIMDEDGFCIKDGVLYAYRGLQEEITIPEAVKEIYMNAFSKDYNHGVNVRKVTVPGTLKTVGESAFAFTGAVEIVIEEGVETLGERSFMNSYFGKIWLPKSLTSIGDGAFSVEGSYNGAKFVVKEGSFAHEFLTKNAPYGAAELMVLAESR